MTTPDRSSQIRQHALDYLASIEEGADGSTTIDLSQKGLLDTFGEFHKMSRSELCSVAVALTQMSLHRGQNLVLRGDEPYFHAWCAQLLLAPVEGNYTGATYGFPGGLGSLEICFRSALAYRTTAISDPRFDANARAVLEHSGGLLTFSAFAGLEMLLRRSLPQLELDGTVLADFSVDTPNGTKKFKANGKARCSNIGIALRLFHGQVASPELADNIKQILDHIAYVDGAGADGFSVLFDWRNSTMHGEQENRTVGEALLHLIIVILLDQASATFSDRQTAALKYAFPESPFGLPLPRSEWQYYPPT